VSLRTVRQALIGSLESGNFEHEARAALAERNLLAVGDVDAAFVVRLLQRTRGDRYATSRHDWDREVTVHVFRPELDGERWYVKAYFLDVQAGRAVFISVHN